MGMIYMFLEMHKQGILKESVRPALLGASAGFALMLLFTAGTGQLFALQAIASLWLPMSAVGLLVGGMLGVLTVGTRVSKPFPFGPALAAGGLAAVLLRHSL